MRQEPFYPVLVEPFHHLIRYSNIFPDRLDEFFAKLPRTCG